LSETLIKARLVMFFPFIFKLSTYEFFDS